MRSPVLQPSVDGVWNCSMLDGDESKVTVGQFEFQNNLEEVQIKYKWAFVGKVNDVSLRLLFLSCSMMDQRWSS